MKDYFNSLNDREKWIVVLGSVCLGIYLFYMLIYAPLTHSVQTKSKQLIEKMQTLEWMKKIQQQGDMGKPKKSVNNNQLLTVIASQLKEQSQLHYPYQLQQTGSGDIELSFNEVPFQLCLTWLAQLNKEYQVTFKQLDVTPTGTPGVTKLMLILTSS